MSQIEFHEDSMPYIFYFSNSLGIDTINSIAKLRGALWTISKDQRLHNKCRKNFTNKKTFVKSKPEKEINKPRTRSSTGSDTQFEYRTNCLFCTERVCKIVDNNVEIISKKKKEIEGISFVASKEQFDNNLRETLKGRTDNWSLEVAGRVKSVSCLRAEEAVYHRKCYQLFLLGRKR